MAFFLQIDTFCPEK